VSSPHSRVLTFLCRPLVVSMAAGLLATSAVAQPSGAAASLVLRLTALRSSAGAAPVSAFWFVVALGPLPAGSRVKAGHTAGLQNGDDASPWVDLDPNRDLAVLVVLVREASNEADLSQRSAAMLDQALRKALDRELSRPQAVAQLRDDLLQAFAASPPREAVQGRVIGSSELRLTQGDLASARVGLVVTKQLDFRADRSFYRLSFQLARADRVLQPDATH
jgi:hypothetical protein